MTYTIDTIELDHGITIKIHPDEDAGSPREWSNLGIMYCWHPDYTLGDEQFTRGDHGSVEAVYEYVRDERKATHVLPLFLLDHSGIAMRAGALIEQLSPGAVQPTNRFMGDDAGWDTSWVGFIYTTAEKRAEMGTPDELVEQALRDEVEVYSTFIEGGAMGYVIEDEDGEHLGSCWSFFELDHCKDEAKAEAEHYVQEHAKVERNNELALACWRD